VFQNYIKTALRNLKRYKGYSFINLLGLAIGIACCILILLYVQDEFSYDRFALEYEDVYRIVLDIQAPERGEMHVARTPPPWGPSLADDYPEVESYVRLKTPLVSWLVSNEAVDKRFHEKGFYFADHTVFEFFSLPMLSGDPASALVEPRTVVLTETAAHKYFGDEDPMGRTIRLDNTYDFQVTGVMRDVPKHSHFDFDILASISTLGVVPIYGGDAYLTWRNGLGPDLYTYIRLQEGTPPGEFEGKLPEFLGRYMGEVLNRINVRFEPRLQPLSRIHLHSNLEAEIRANSDIRYIYIFSAIAIFVLIIACINFMNLATARSATRAREIGMRKVVGANRWRIIQQFLSESVLMALVSLIFALILVGLLAQPLARMADLPDGSQLFDPGILPVFLLVALISGLLAGSYPALFLSSFQPASVLKGRQKSGSALFRRVLVVFQFAISIFLLVGMMFMSRQIDHMGRQALGFSKERGSIHNPTQSLRKLLVDLKGARINP